MKDADVRPLVNGFTPTLVKRQAGAGGKNSCHRLPPAFKLLSPERRAHPGLSNRLPNEVYHSAATLRFPARFLPCFPIDSGILRATLSKRLPTRKPRSHQRHWKRPGEPNHICGCSLAHLRPCCGGTLSNTRCMPCRIHARIAVRIAGPIRQSSSSPPI